MGNYSVIKAKAIEFAQEGRTAYIAKARRNNHHYIIFDKKDLTKNHRIVEIVSPEGSSWKSTYIE